MPNRNVPSFFFTKHTGEAHEEIDGSITPVANIRRGFHPLLPGLLLVVYAVTV